MAQAEEILNYRVVAGMPSLKEFLYLLPNECK